MVGKELMADVVEIANDRHVDVHAEQALLDMRHGGGCLVAVNRNAHDFRTSPRQVRDLLGGRLDVGGIGIGHRLHDNGRAAADGDVANLYGDGSMPFGGAGKFHHWRSPLGAEPILAPGQGENGRPRYSLTEGG